MARKTPVAKHRVAWLIPAAVGILTVLAFLPVLQNGFVTWDDDRNFLDNPNYRGLGLAQLRWMWTTFHLGHYVPLSWMTLGLDYELWGMDARGYHLTSLLLHAANAVLVFFIARRLLRFAAPAGAGDRALSLAAAFAALLFSVHPLRVESVAWVTERRDVLSGLCCAATLLAYLRAADTPGGARRSYWLSVGLFACALLSKATSLTLPVILVILNIYPLKRLGGRAGWRGHAARAVYAEIAPFALLAAAAVPLTLVALAPPDQLGTGAKIAVSAYSLAFYLWKSLLPTGLSPLYEMPVSVDPFAARYVVSYVVVIAAAAGAWLARRRLPGLTAAALVFLVVIFPLLGIVQNGPQIAADRYTYHAAPALAVAAAAGALLLSGAAAAAMRIVAVAIAVAIVVALGALTWRQALVWHDSLRFWTYVASTDSTSSVAQTALGTLALGDQRLGDAIARYELALRYNPKTAEGHNNLGIALAKQGKIADAAAQYRQALALSPRNRETHNNLGVIAAKLGNATEALAEYQEALEIDPGYADAHVNWGNLLVRMGKPADAIDHYREAIRLQPENADAHFNWGVALAQTNRLPAAIDEFRRALAINPAHAEAREYLEKALELERSARDTARD